MNIKELNETFKKHNFRAKKKLGQNFLVDNNIRTKMVKAMDLNAKDIVLEIGPGLGAMTFRIAGSCKRLYAIEKDTKAFKILKDRVIEESNVELINDDFLEIEIEKIAKRNKIKVFGNIPYYISTPIIEKIIISKKRVKEVFITIQKEVADRATARPGSKDYSSFSCFVQYHTKPEKLFKIKKNCFCPKPKVESCFLKLNILEKPSVKVKDEELFFKIVRGAFSQRRKKAVNPLGRKVEIGLNRDEWVSAFKGCSIDISSRAENISIEQYAELSNYVSVL